jgi:hypothetical protein
VPLTYPMLCVISVTIYSGIKTDALDPASKLSRKKVREQEK